MRLDKVICCSKAKPICLNNRTKLKTKLEATNFLLPNLNLTTPN